MRCHPFNLLIAGPGEDQMQIKISHFNPHSKRRIPPCWTPVLCSTHLHGLTPLPLQSEVRNVIISSFHFAIPDAALTD
jgi:hypothetical protein